MRAQLTSCGLSVLVCYVRCLLTSATVDGWLTCNRSFRVDLRPPTGDVDDDLMRLFLRVSVFKCDSVKSMSYIFTSLLSRGYMSK